MAKVTGSDDIANKYVNAALSWREPSVVYYIRWQDSVKIGTTSNLKRRLTDLPYTEVLLTEPGSYSLEKYRHMQFADKNIQGEWFTYDNELDEFICSRRDELSEINTMFWPTMPPLPWCKGIGVGAPGGVAGKHVRDELGTPKHYDHDAGEKWRPLKQALAVAYARTGVSVPRGSVWLLEKQGKVRVLRDHLGNKLYLASDFAKHSLYLHSVT